MTFDTLTLGFLVAFIIFDVAMSIITLVVLVRRYKKIYGKYKRVKDSQGTTMLERLRGQTGDGSFPVPKGAVDDEEQKKQQEDEQSATSSSLSSSSSSTSSSSIGASSKNMSTSSLASEAVLAKQDN